MPPTFVFHPDERDFPADAEEYLKAASKSAAGHLISGLGDTETPFNPLAPIYVRETNNFTQWWIFYSFNRKFGGNHEADWESVTVFPSHVYISSHGGGTFHKKLEKIYVAEGSHAHSHKPGVKIRLCCLGNDHFGDGIEWTPVNVVEIDENHEVVLHKKDWGQRGVSGLGRRKEFQPDFNPSR